MYMNVLRSLLLLGTTVCIGASQAQWEPFACGHNANVSITSGPGAVYKANFAVGVYKSTTGGASWDLMNNGLPLNGGLVYAESVCYDGTRLFCGTQSGIYRSTDGAANWTLTNTGAPVCSSTNFPNKFYHVPGTTTTLAIYSAAISAGGGLYRTTDGGVNWFSGNGGLSSNMVVHNVALINGILYVATSTGILTSTNLAVSWTQLGSGSSNFQTFAIQGTASRLVVVSSFGLRYSNNNGGVWTNGTGVSVGSPAKGELIRYDGKYWAIAGSTVCRSLNDGTTWAEYETGLGGADTFGQEEFHASGTTLYLGCLQDIYGHDGTTVGTEEIAAATLPTPYPTVFNANFTVDLSNQEAGRSLVLIDAMGREVQRHNNLPAEPMRIERNGMLAGTYRVMLIDPRTGAMVPLGAVIAE